MAYGDVAQYGGAGADRCALAHGGRFDFPICLGLKFTFRGRRPRIAVVDKRHTVADENVIFDVHAFTNKGVAGNLAAPPNARIFLNFHEGAYFGFVADFTSIHVDELGELDVFPKLDVGDDAHKLVHRITASPRFRTERSAASRMRTTRSPATPSLKGLLLA